MYYPVFALYFVCRLGEEHPRGLLPHDIFAASFVRQLVGWIRLSIAKL
jgi:hypothetical protein